MENAQDKIRIAIVENDLFVGGVQRLVLEQIAALDSDRFEILLITLTKQNRTDLYHKVPSHVRVRKHQFKSIIDFMGWFALAKDLKSFDPHLVKTTTYFSNTIVRCLRLLTGKYVVVAAEHNTKHVKTKFQKFVNKILANVSATTIVDSQMVAEFLSQSEHIPEDKFTIIHNGADIQVIDSYIKQYALQRSVLREQFGVKDRELLFLNIARLVKQKNHIRLVSAFKKLHDKKPDTKLFIVGEGLVRADLERYIKDHNLGKSVLLLGEHSDIHRFYLMSDFGVMSSDHEGFSIAAIEGMAFGVPLISTKVGGASEYLIDGKNGYLSEHSTSMLAKKLVQASDLSYEDYILMKNEARKTAERYSTERYQDSFRTLVVSLVSNGERPPLFN